MIIFDVHAKGDWDLKGDSIFKVKADGNNGDINREMRKLRMRLDCGGGGGGERNILIY